MSQIHLEHIFSNMQLKMVLANKLIVPKNWHYNNRVNPFTKLYYIVDGEGRIAINNVEVNAKKNSLILIPSNTSHDLEANLTNPYEKYYLHFIFQSQHIDITSLVNLPNIINTSSTQEAENIKKCFDEILFYQNNQSMISRYMIDLNIRKLLIPFIEESKIKSSNSKTLEINKVLDYIETNIRQKIQIEELSSIINLHPNYFIRFFKKNLGVTPVAYINHKKIEEAQKLLQSSAMSIKEIAYELGFCQEFYFSQRFKKETGKSPLEYRMEFK